MRCNGFSFIYNDFFPKDKDFMSRTEALFLTNAQEEYLSWLLTPENARTPATKKAWAEEHEVHINTLGTWEKKKNFIERWSIGVKGLAESPERTQSLLDALYIKGVSGDTKSAELYLKATGFLQQAQTVNIKTESSVKDLSDAELQAMIVEITQQKIKNKE
jgi:hypothetical protein